MFGPTTLGDYSSALEMAFSINILIPAWAGVYRLIIEARDSSIQILDEIEKTAVLLEDVSDARSEVEGLAKRARFWWHAGLCICLVVSGILFASLTLLPSTTVISYEWRLGLLLASVCGPLCMLRMFWIGRNQKEKSELSIKRIKQREARAKRRYEKIGSPSTGALYKM